MSGSEPAPDQFPVGAAVTLDDLGGDLHPVLRRLRASEPVSWLPVAAQALGPGDADPPHVLWDAPR